MKRKLEVIKLDVEEALKHKYVDFIPQYIKMDKLLHAFKRFSVDYEQLHNQIEKEVCKQQLSFYLFHTFFLLMIKIVLLLFLICEIEVPVAETAN